jgi:hypothetical protein
MSALPPKADIGERDRNVRFVPKGDIGRRQLDVRFVPKTDMAQLFDHFVGVQQE